MQYDDSLDPISPNFDPEHFRSRPPNVVGPNPFDAPTDTPAERVPEIDEHLLRTLIQHHTTMPAGPNAWTNRLPVSISFAERRALVLRRKVSPVDMLRVRLTRYAN